MIKYTYIDGDNIGLKIETNFLENNESELSIINKKITRIISEITLMLENEMEQKIIFSGADGIICKGAQLNNRVLLERIRLLDNCITFSIGTGDTLRECYIALRYAKAVGKNTAVTYSNNNFIENSNI